MGLRYPAAYCGVVHLASNGFALVQTRIQAKRRQLTSPG
jgi:hypothetical protein